jgi:hypothetical protein
MTSKLRLLSIAFMTGAKPGDSELSVSPMDEE